MRRGMRKGKGKGKRRKGKEMSKREVEDKQQGSRVHPGHHSVVQ
jgi:hypothetical protein